MLDSDRPSNSQNNRLRQVQNSGRINLFNNEWINKPPLLTSMLLVAKKNWTNFSPSAIFVEVFKIKAANLRLCFVWSSLWLYITIHLYLQHLYKRTVSFIPSHLSTYADVISWVVVALSKLSFVIYAMFFNVVVWTHHSRTELVIYAMFFNVVWTHHSRTELCYLRPLLFIYSSGIAPLNW
jgi:hypothetical protein